MSPQNNGSNSDVWIHALPRQINIRATKDMPLSITPILNGMSVGCDLLCQSGSSRDRHLFSKPLGCTLEPGHPGFPAGTGPSLPYIHTVAIPTTSLLPSEVALRITMV